MPNKERGLLIILSGPSGVGKGTVCKSLLQRDARLIFSISATTRAPRPGEVDGESYFFVTQERFRQMIRDEEFLEYMDVFGANYYGTPKEYVEKQRNEGRDVVLDIDVHGARKVRALCPDAVSIFIAPPSMETLRRRLLGRGTEDAHSVERRYKEAFEELKRVGEYDYIVVNDVLAAAVADVEHIVHAERMRTARRMEFVNILQGGH